MGTSTPTRETSNEGARYEDTADRLSFEAVAGVGTEASDMASSDNAEMQEIVKLAYALTELADGKLKINFFHGGKGNSIYGRYRNGRIDINADRVDANGANLIRITLSHELTHYIQDKSPRQYERLKSFMLDRLMDEQNLTLEELIQQKQAREPGLGYEGAIDEIVADGCEEMLLDPKIVEELAQKEKSLAREIVDWLRGVLERLVNSITGTHKEAVAMRAYAEQLREIWGQGLAEALASEETQNNKNTAEDGGAKWSKAMTQQDIEMLKRTDVIQMLDDAHNGKYVSRSFIPVRRNTPEILQLISSKFIEFRQIDSSLPMIMQVGHIQQIMDEDMTDIDAYSSHDLSAQDIVSILEGLDKPKQVYYQKDNGRYAMIVNFKSGKQKSRAFAIVDFSGNKSPNTLNGYQGGTYNIVVTAFSPESSYLKKYAANENNVLVYDINKGGLQSESGSPVPSYLNSPPFYEPIIPQDTGKSQPKYSRADVENQYLNLSYSEINKKMKEAYHEESEIQAKQRELSNDKELLEAKNKISRYSVELKNLFPKKRKGEATATELERIDEIRAARAESTAEVAEIENRLGLNQVNEKLFNIRENIRALRKASEYALEREGAEKENKLIKESGLSAEEYFRKKAIGEFGYTSDFKEAGYMLPNGKLLNFSGGERGRRTRDHREICAIYEATQQTAALNRFLNDGNIRVMAESPGVDISSVHTPTAEQYATLRKFINTIGIKNGEFYVDFSAADGLNEGKYEYSGKINADRIINDIKYFFDNGTAREQSGLSAFYSRADVSPEELQKKLRESERARRKAERLKAKAVEQAEYWRNQARVRPEKRMKAEDVKSFARDILKQYSYSSVKADELYGRLLILARRFTDYDNSTDASWLYDEAYGIAQSIIDSSYARLNENGEIVPATDRNNKAVPVLRCRRLKGVSPSNNMMKHDAEGRPLRLFGC